MSRKVRCRDFIVKHVFLESQLSDLQMMILKGQSDRIKDMYGIHVNGTVVAYRTQRIGKPGPILGLIDSTLNKYRVIFTLEEEVDQ